tara:strand:+ start:231 stop:587 length:357 start_codon:yes stop_codon:yes gene_type:complete
MPASLDDILTTQKNGVVAINNLSSSISRDQGTVTSSTVTGNTLVVAGKGYVANFSVTVAGTTAGTINNAASVSTAAASNALCAVPNTIGVYHTGLVFTNGIVIQPGTGQSVNVTYSLG